MATLNGNTLSFEAVLDDKDFDQGLSAIAEKALSFAKEQNRMGDLAIKQQKEYTRLLMNSGDAFKSLDIGTQQQIARMSTLQSEMKRVEVSQRALTESFKNGKVTEEAYNANMTKLTATERSLVVEMAKVTAELSRNEAVMKASNGSINEKIEKLNRLKKAYDDLGEGDRNAVNIGGKALKDIQILEREIGQLKNAMQALPELKIGSIDAKTADLAKLKQEYTALSAIDRRSDIGKQMARNIKEAEKEVEKLNAEFQKTENFAKRAMQAAGAYFSIQTATSFIRDIATVRGEFQQLETSLETILQSKEKADQLLADVTELAAKTPFSLREVGEGSKLLLAYQFSADEVTDTLTRLGNVASGLSIPFKDLVQLYGKTRTEGRLFAEDLNQFTGRGIPIIAELANIMGVAESEVRGLVTAGKVGFPEVEKVFQNLTSAGGSFFGLMEKNSKSLTGQISNLGDAYDKMLNSIGESNEGIFNAAIASATTLVENYETVLEILTGLVAVYGSYRAALIATAVAQRLHMALMLAQATSSTTLTVAQTLQIANTKLLAIAQAAYNRVLAASPIVAYTAVIAALGLAIYSLVQAQSAATAIQERFVNIQGEGSAAAAKERQNINQLISVIKSEVATREQKEAALKKLNEATGGVLKSYSQEEIAAGKAKDAIDEYIKSVENATKARVAFDELNKLNEQIAELETKGIQAVSVYDRLGQSLKNTFGAGGISLEEWGKGLIDGAAQNETIVKQMVDSLRKQKEAIEDEFKKELNGQISGVEAGGNENATEAIKRTVAIIDEEIKKEKENQTAISATSAEWKKYEETIKSLEAERTRITGSMSKEVKKWADDRKKILEDLANAEKEAANAGLSANEKEIAANREKYDQLRKLVEDFNKEAPKSQQISVGVVARIDRLEESTTGELLFKQETEKLKESLEKQKELYTEFEEYKKEYGAKAAKDRFENELDTSKTYLQQIQAALDSVRAIPADQLTPKQQERYVDLLKQEAAEEKRIRDAAFDENIKNFKRIVEATKTAAAERLRIEKEYNEDLATLEKNLPGEENKAKLDAQKEMLDERRRLQEEANKHLAFQETEFYKKMMNDITFLSREELKERVKELRKILQDPKLSPVQRKAAQQAVGQAQSFLDETNKTAQDAEKVAKFAAVTADSFGRLADSLKVSNPLLSNMLKSVSDIAGIAGSAASSLAGFAMGPLGIAQGISGAVGAISGLINLFDTSAQKQKMAEEARQRALEATSRAIDEMNRKLDQQAETIERALGFDKIVEYRKQIGFLKNDLLKTIEQLNGLSLETWMIDPRSGRLIIEEYSIELKKLMDLVEGSDGGRGRPSRGGQAGTAEPDRVLQTLEEVIKENQKQINQIYDALSKGIIQGDIEQLKTLLETYEQLEDQLYEYQQRIQETLTGSTYTGIVDSIADGFREGLSSAEIFANNFEDLMRNAIIQSLRMSALEKPLKAFYDQLALMTESGGTLDNEEIEALQKLYKEILKNAEEQFKSLKDITEIDFGDAAGAANEKAGLSGAIRGITESQADLLAGQFNALRLHVADILQLMRIQTGTDPQTAIYQQQAVNIAEQTRIAFQSLQIQVRIEANTALTVSRLVDVVGRLDSQLSSLNQQTKHLKSLDDKIQRPDNTLRANGYTGG